MIEALPAFESSNVAAVQYDPGAKHLFVTFKNQQRYRYESVSQPMWDKMKSAESVGGFVSKAYRPATQGAQAGLSLTKMAIRKLFQMDIGVDDDSGNYVGQIHSVTDKTAMACAAESLRKLAPALTKFLRQKHNELRKFPLPEENRSPIVLTNGSRIMLPPSRP